jgi:hypothetical protein
VLTLFRCQLMAGIYPQLGVPRNMQQQICNLLCFICSKCIKLMYKSSIVSDGPRILSLKLIIGLRWKLVLGI